MFFDVAVLGFKLELGVASALFGPSACQGPQRPFFTRRSRKLKKALISLKEALLGRASCPHLSLEMRWPEAWGGRRFRGGPGGIQG